MNTFLTESDRTIKQEFEQFAKDKLTPHLGELRGGKFSPNIFLQNMAEAGFLGLNVPSEYAGKNSPFLHSVLLAETLSNYDAGIVLYFAYHIATIELIKAYASDEQKRTYLPKLARGQLLGSLAYLELESKTIEIVPQDKNFFLHGQKTLVVVNEETISQRSNKIKTGQLLLVSVGKNFILVDDLNVSTIKMQKQNMPMGFTSVSFANLTFDNYIFNAGAYLGEVLPEDNHFNSSLSNGNSIELPNGEKLILARNIIRTLLAAAALGMSDSVLSESIDYTKNNKRSGVALSQSEAIQWKLADAATDTSAARLLTYRAAWSKEEDPDSFSRYATMAKAYATRIARLHTSEGLQIILPFLQNPNSPLTSFYVDSKLLETFDSTNEEEKVSLSKLLGI